MRVVLSVGGTFHAPHLAYQLQKHEMLAAVYTSIPPRRYINRAPIDRAKFRWCLWPEMVGPRIPALLRLPGKFRGRFHYWYAVCFDRTVRRQIRKAEMDMFVVFNCYGLESIRAMRERGIITVVERGSAHSRFREALLDEEYERLGLDRSDSLPPEALERELAEYAEADYIVVPSAFAESSFRHEGVEPRKVKTVPLGVDTGLFRPQPAPKPAKFRVLAAGNLGIEKGTHYLLAALEKLAIPDIELVLAGTLDPYFRGKLAKTQVPWEFAGHVPQQSLPHYYHSAAVSCLTSIEDGFGMVVLEAMACGVPSIVSTHTCAGDVVRDGQDGYVVPVRDVETLAERILTLYHDPELREAMGVQARQRAEAFTWDAYGDRLTQCYADMLGISKGVNDGPTHIDPAMKQG